MAEPSDALMPTAPPPVAPEGEGEGGGEEAEGEESLENLPEVSLEIFNVIKSSHAQHGLRHGDYVRYRQYCSRRLHRVRKGVGFLHGKGRYAKRVMEPRSVRDGRFLIGDDTAYNHRLDTEAANFVLRRRAFH